MMVSPMSFPFLKVFLKMLETINDEVVGSLTLIQTTVLAKSLNNLKRDASPPHDPVQHEGCLDVIVFL